MFNKNFFIHICLAIGAVFFAIILFLFAGLPSITKNAEYGVTFSRYYAQDELHIDGNKILIAALDDLGIRRFRLSAYWGFIENKPAKWDFATLDREIKEISKRGGTVVLAVGEKLPRWPECWGPEWWKALPRDEQRSYTLRYIERVVNQYKNNPTIVAWQVENEAHFVYGDCPLPDPDFLRQEIALVKKLDPGRPVVTTDSGELSAWISAGRLVDKLGVSVYRVVRTKQNFIFRYWFLPPHFYFHKALIARLFGVRQIYVSEFQMEPWNDKHLSDTPVDKQLETMSLKQMEKNFYFAERMQLSPVDFWGVEWWYWMKEKGGHPEFWETAKTFFKNHQ